MERSGQKGRIKHREKAELSPHRPLWKKHKDVEKETKRYKLSAI
jgi:hypothetical protein